VSQKLVRDGENKTLLLIGRNVTQGKVDFWLLFILQHLRFTLWWVSRFVFSCCLEDMYQHCIMTLLFLQVIDTHLANYSVSSQRQLSCLSCSLHLYQICYTRLWIHSEWYVTNECHYILKQVIDMQRFFTIMSLT
jgi:hypothetical protein